MSSSPYKSAGPSGHSGRFSSLPRVFVMSALGAFILGAAFWPPSGFERRMGVILDLDQSLSDEDRREELSRIEATIADADRVKEWSQYADAETRPRSFVWTQIAAFAPTPSAIVSTTTAVSPGRRAIVRSAHARFGRRARACSTAR